MRAHIRRFATVLAAVSTLAGTQLAIPVAAPQGPLDMPSNCLPGQFGQLIYCDSDIRPGGKWVRCYSPRPQPLVVFGAITGASVPGSGAPSCQLVTPQTLPAWSPPYHIGYGPPSPGRVPGR